MRRKSQHPLGLGANATTSDGNAPERPQGNRVKKSCGDQTCEEFIVPWGDFAFEAKAVFAGGFSDQVESDVVVKLAGAFSVRMRHSSSRKIMSITQCRLFSIVQWPRMIGHEHTRQQH